LLKICHLKYGSWTHKGNDLELFIDDSKMEEGHKMDKTYYVLNGEWELVGKGLPDKEGTRKTSFKLLLPRRSSHHSRAAAM